MNLLRRLALPSLLVGLITAFLLQVRPFTPAKPFRLLVPLRSDAAGRALLTCCGTHDPVLTERQARPVTKGEQVLSFNLPFTTTHAVRFRAQDAITSLRLDPLDRAGCVAIGKVTLVGPQGAVVETFDPSAISATKPSLELKTDGGTVAFTSEPGEGVFFHPKKPLQLARRTVTIDPASAAKQIGGATLALLLVFALANRVPASARAWLAATLVRLRDDHAAWPVATLFIAAAFATAASCYPIIFCGKSFISPGYGPTRMLCSAGPEAMQPSQALIENGRGADTGAMMWAQLPYSVIQHRAIFKHGELPLWNRYTSCGTPLLGQGQSMLGDPLHWIPIAAGGSAWAWDVKFCIAKLLFSLGAGLLTFAATRRIWLAALLTISSSFLGFFSFRFGHCASFSICYSPWILLCWLRAARTTGRVWPWALALAAANFWELNSGTISESAALIACLNFTGGLLVLTAEGGWRQRLPRFALMSFGLVLFVMLSAPHWMLLLDALRHTVTNSAPTAITQLPPHLAIGLFDDLFSSPLKNSESLSHASANFLVLLGCLWAAVNLRRLLADKTFAAVLLGAALPAAMTFGVIPRECLVRLPFIEIIGHLGDTFSCVLIIHLLIIATFGLRSMWDRPVKKYAGTDMLIAAIFLALLAAIFFAHAHILHGADRTSAQHGSAAKMSVFFCAYATALFAALLALPWIVRGIRLRPTAGHLVAGGLCLFLLHFRHGLWTETKFDSYVANPRIRTDLAAFSPTISLLRESFESTGQPARVAGIGGVLAPGFNAVLGLEHFTGADALTNMWQWDLLEKSSIPLTADRRSFLTRASFPRTRTFGDLWNIRWYLGDPAELPHEVNGIEAVKALDLDIYASHRAWPRAFFTDRLPECSSLENFIDLLTSADGRPFAAIVPAKPSDAKPAQPESLTGRAVVAAHDYRLTENSTAFTIEAPTPGVTVLGNSFEPGNWRVTLDGHPVKCFRVNHAFLGVAIPDAGVHTLRFSYWPHTLTPALKIALGGLLLALSAVCLGIQNNSSRSPLLHREGSPH